MKSLVDLGPCKDVFRGFPEGASMMVETGGVVGFKIPQEEAHST